MIWQVRWRRRAETELNNLPQQTRERVLAAIERLAGTEHGDIIKLRGRESEWRLRVGDWRVMLFLDHQNSIMEILRVLHRREAYR